MDESDVSNVLLNSVLQTTPSVLAGSTASFGRTS